MMFHRNYHEISAQDHVDAGRQLGKRFGAILSGHVQEARQGRTWPNHRRKAERLLETTHRHFPDYVEELAAYAAAAGIPLLDLWTVSIEDELDEEDTERCTSVVTGDGRLLGHNEDWSADATDEICILKKTVASVTSLELYYYGCPLGGVAVSINSNGYIQMINSLRCLDNGNGIPKTIIARRLSEMKDADLELGDILSLPRASGFSHTLVNRRGRVTNIECTGTRSRTRTVPLPFVHTNHVLCPELATLEWLDPESCTKERYAHAASQITGTMTQSELSDAMRRGGTRKSATVFNENTIAQAVVDLDTRKALFWLRRERKSGFLPYPIDFFVEEPLA
jgi:hypothetical protein